jgi:hypothetical protein
MLQIDDAALTTIATALERMKKLAPLTGFDRSAATRGPP